MEHNSVDSLLYGAIQSHGSLGQLYNTCQQQPRVSNRLQQNNQIRNPQNSQNTQQTLTDNSGFRWILKPGQAMNSTTMPGFQIDPASAALNAARHAQQMTAENLLIHQQAQQGIVQPQTRKDLGMRKVYSGDNDGYYNYTSMPTDDYTNKMYTTQQESQIQKQQQPQITHKQTIFEDDDDDKPLLTKSQSKKETVITLSKPTHKITMDLDDDTDADVEQAIKNSLADVDTSQLDMQLYSALTSKFPNLQSAYIEIDKLTNNVIFLKNELEAKTNDSLKNETKIRKYEDMINKQTDVITKLQNYKNNTNSNDSEYVKNLVDKNKQLSDSNEHLLTERGILVSGAKELRIIAKGLSTEKDFLTKKVVDLENEIKQINQQNLDWKIGKTKELSELKKQIDITQKSQQQQQNQYNNDEYNPKYTALNDKFKLLTKQHEKLKVKFEEIYRAQSSLQLTNITLEGDRDKLIIELLISRNEMTDNRDESTVQRVEKIINDYKEKVKDKAAMPDGRTTGKKKKNKSKKDVEKNQSQLPDNTASESTSSSFSVAKGLELIMADEKIKDFIKKDSDDDDTDEKGKEKVKETTTTNDDNNTIFISSNETTKDTSNIIHLTQVKKDCDPPTYESLDFMQQSNLMQKDEIDKTLANFKPKSDVLIKKVMNVRVYNVDIGCNDIDANPMSHDNWCDEVEEAERNDTVYVKAKPYGGLPIGDAKIGNIMVYHGVNSSIYNMKRMMFYSQRPFSKFPVGEETEKFYISSLAIIPAIDDEHTMGYFGSIEKYKVRNIDSLHLPNCVTRRIKTNNGAISFNIPSCLNSTPDDEIIKIFNNGVDVFSTFQRNARVNLGLSITLFNNMLRNYGKFSMPPPELIEQYEAGKPVFGKILNAIGDGSLILGGRWIESVPVGGYQINSNKLHYGPFKANNPWHKQKIVWDTTGMEVTTENVQKCYEELEKFYSQTRQYVCYHLYMSRQTIHFHVFNSIDDIKYSIMCDLITDYPKTLLNKGAPLDILYPIHAGTEDVTLLAIAFYCHAVRMAPSLYNSALDGNLDLDRLILLFKATPCYEDIAKRWESRDIQCRTSTNTFGKYFIKPIELTITYSTPEREVSGTIIEHGYVHPNHWVSHYFDRKVTIHPSPSALQYEPQISPTSTWKTHDTFYANGRSNCEVPRSYNIPNVVCGKTCYNRGKAKMVDMLGLNFIRKVCQDAKSILVLGEKRGGFAHALIENGIFKKKLYLLDLQFEPQVKAEFGDRCLERDIASLTIEDINKFDVVISDVCDSKGVLNSRFMQVYDNWITNAKTNITFLLKLKGIITDGVKTKYGDWVDNLANTYSRTYLVKPYSSRCRNSEVYFYLDKQFIHNSSGSICYYYAEQLENRIRESEQFLVPSTVYSMMNVMTPLQTMELREFIKYIPNRGSAEFILEDRNTFDMVAGCFAKTRMFRIGENYYFQGEDFRIATKFNVYKCKSVIVNTGLWEPVSAIPPIKVVQKTINPKPSIIANCIKDTIIDKFHKDDVVDFGCGESGVMYYKDNHVTYASAFSAYEGVDPLFNTKFEDFKCNGNNRTALFIQSMHHISMPVHQVIRKCFDLGFKTVVYNTQKSSRIKIKHAGKGQQEDWYSNDGVNVTWCGETNKLVPMYGQVFGISSDYFRTYNRTYNSTWRMVASDQVICVVTPSNFIQTRLYGATYTGVTSAPKMFSPKAREELSVKKEGDDTFVSPKTKELFK